MLKTPGIFYSYNPWPLIAKCSRPCPPRLESDSHTLTITRPPPPAPLVPSGIRRQMGKTSHITACLPFLSFPPFFFPLSPAENPIIRGY